MKKTLFYALPIATLAIFLGSIGYSYAQNLNPNQTPQRGMMAGVGSKWEIKAQILGLTQEELKSQLQTGKTFAQILQEKGLNLEQFQEKVLEQKKQKLQSMVQAGQITQAQADQRLEQMQVGQQNCAGGALMGLKAGFGQGHMGMRSNQ